MADLPSTLPDRFTDEDHLEEVMTTPSPALEAALREVPGDLIVLGVSGKMGPTLARLARRASPGRRIIGVARFGEPGPRAKLESSGIECIAADLLERDAVARLPKVPNVIFMAGRKFGTTGREDLTWAMNALVPAHVAEAFKESRIVALSTANVYPFVPVVHGGATESVAPDPRGAYANSCVARERLFEYFSAKHGTPGRLIRLSYAIDTRYGVLHDVARKVLARQEIDLAAGHVNVIWQGDANSMVLQALHHCTAPTRPLNVSGPETVSIGALAEAFGARFGHPPRFVGSEAPIGLLMSSVEAHRLFGNPSVSLGRMIDWVAAWLGAGLRSLGKETHYDNRDGAF
jgi:nucleoside-diphosphate-sugar epimerase